MQRILNQKEIVGPSGALHDKAIDRLHAKGFFSTSELTQIGAKLIENIPDNGQAKKALEKILQ